MYTCEQCGAEFDYLLKSCELCNGPVQNNGRPSYTETPPPQTTTARYREPEQPRYLPPPPRYLPPQEPQQPYNEYLPPRDSYQQPRGTAENFRALFGLHPTVAAIAIIFGGALATTELISGVLSLPIFGFVGMPVELGALVTGLIASVPMAVVTYLAQVEWSHDTKRSAGIKALMIGLMTALPGGVLAYKKLKKLMEELAS